jgi:Mn-containing catalase
VPWTAAYINGDATGELTADLRSDIAAESRAKMVYEYLLQFTEDPYVKETLRFLMTREVAHFQMFEAALDTIRPNFPPGVLQSDPKFSNVYFNMSSGNDFTGPWNEGKSTQLGETIQYVADPIDYVLQTNSLLDHEGSGSDRTDEAVQAINRQMSKLKSEEVNGSFPDGIQQWNQPLPSTGDRKQKKSAKSTNGTKEKKRAAR